MTWSIPCMHIQMHYKHEHQSIFQKTIHELMYSICDVKKIIQYVVCSSQRGITKDTETELMVGSYPFPRDNPAISHSCQLCDTRAHICRLDISGPRGCLTHIPLDKMAAISHTIFAVALSWIKSFVFWLKLHWRLFSRVHLTITQRWFIYWIGATQAISYYMNQSCC